MNTEVATHLLSIGSSVAKLASEGGQLFLDKLSLFGFFAFCLLFVGACLTIPNHLYEKYYKTGDDEEQPSAIVHEMPLDAASRPEHGPAA